MAKKLAAKADYYLIKTLCMAYVNSRVDSNIYKHLVTRFKMRVCKPFIIAEKMFEVLQKVYGDSNYAHMATNKFHDLKITGDFNNFWVEFQVLAWELDHSKSMLIGKLKYKLTPSLS